jgi:FkbM family methyltransferase
MLISLDKIINDYNLNIKGVIHIGAHYGQEYNDYIKHNITNLMFFEPLHKNYNVLLNNINLTDTVKAYNIALGNFTGTVDMFVETFNQGMSSSILEPKIHLTQYPNIKFNEKENVKIEKLDNIVFNRTHFNMINIDVQGYELEVFKGAIETLKDIDIIYTEVNRDEVYKNCVKVNELDDFLVAFGFERKLSNWGGDTWGDALYIKNIN